MDIIISVIIMFDEKFALIFHKNFLLTRRNPLIQRVSLLIFNSSVRPAAHIFLSEYIVYGCPLVQIAGGKAGAHLTVIDFHGRRILRNIICQQISVAEAECDALLAAEGIGDMRTVAGSLIGLGLNVEAGSLFLLQDLCAVHGGEQIEQCSRQIAGTQNCENGKHTDRFAFPHLQNGDHI